MNYHTLTEKLFRMRGAQDIRQSLEIPKRLAERFNFPERAYPTIHVAGTNGKGSTVTKIAKALELSGLKVGLYTSPHLSSFCERISINGVHISEEEVARRLGPLLEFVEKNGVSATFFDIATLLAFEYFRMSQVDVAVIETGLGGRFDATNIVQPLLTIITSIGRDHAEILGESLEEIGREKAGILKQGVPVVLGPRARISSILKQADATHSLVIQVEDTFNFYDEENQAVARAALEHLKEHFPLTRESILEGLKAKPPCRFEQWEDVIFDVAHNADGFSRLIEALKHFYPQRPVFALIGMCKDKEYERCLSQMSTYAEKIYLVEANSLRAVSNGEMARVLAEQDFHQAECGSLTSLLPKARDDARARGALLVICGTFLIMDAAKQRLQLKDKG
ncbi:MAG: bifunctional folylpolyglutamate synthase/dihydrofolate synthase [Chlamydiales bacterium]